MNKLYDKNHAYIIVIPGDGIGGTERRFIELWNYAKYSCLYIVITRICYQNIKAIPHFTSLRDEPQRLFILNASRFLFMIPGIIKIAFRFRKKAIFHYPLTGFSFIHKLLGQTIIRSLPMNDISLLRDTKNKLLTYIQLAFSDKIDVLNPRVIEQLKSHWFFKYSIKNKLSLTKSNSIDITHYPFEIKRENWIIFLGRFTSDGNDVKNIFKYINLLPQLDANLRKMNLLDIKYYILGKGPLEDNIRDILNSPEYKALNICFTYSPNPNSILEYSKIFLSLQKYSNYPSRSLLEAMACGNLPIITKTDESHLIARDDFAYFIPINFDADILSNAVFSILSLNSQQFLEKSKSAQLFVKNNFNISDHLTYYYNLYNN